MDNDDLYFDGKYRIPSARLRGWDYRTSADYYITICTRDMVPWFGFVIDGKMNLNELGRLTKYANTNQLPWGGWQDRFHDHIIKDAASFDNINLYISQNPSNWKSDCYFRR